MSIFDDPEFKRLQNKYYKQIKDAGFQDIEDSKGRLTDHRTVFDASKRIGFKTDFVPDIQSYYTWAIEMVEYGVFASKRDLKIWEGHATGETSRKIAAEISCNQRWVSRKIQFIRAYLRKQTRFEPDEEQ